MGATLFNPKQVQFIQTNRVARLATANQAGEPHVVPICYAFDGECFFSPIDEKPKRLDPSRLRRVRNVKSNPRVSFVIDHYSDDWSELRFLIVEGTATVLEQAVDRFDALELLRIRYEQYRSMVLEERPLLVIQPLSVVEWGFVG